MQFPPKEFYMIRHGESEANRDGYFSGLKDVALTDRGLKQANEARSIFEKLNQKPDIIIHSHLSRARDTAKIMNDNTNIPMIEDRRIAEHDFGDWVGQPWQDVKPLFLAGTNPPNGETRHIFEQRIAHSIKDGLSQYDRPLFACHGGVFRAFFSLTKLDGSLPHIDNCKLYHFKPKAGSWSVTLIS